MSVGSNLMDLCFNISEAYEDYFKDVLRKNNLGERDIETVVNEFDFKKEIIFSLNKEYKKGDSVSNFCRKNNLDLNIPKMIKLGGQLYYHQEEAIKSILNEKCTIISTGTGSGKTESFLIPVLDYCIKNRGKGTKAVIIYPMNALANDQRKRIGKITKDTEITFGIFNGDTPSRIKGEAPPVEIFENEIVYREDIIEELPDILITNYVMLDRILTDKNKKKMFLESKNTLKYVVLDEIHTYRGNKGAHIKFLLHRLRAVLQNKVVQIGCSATLSRGKKGEKQDGYIYGNIDNFIKSMFDEEEGNYNYIQPLYEELKDDFYDTQDKEYLSIVKDIKTKLIRDFLYQESRGLNEILEYLNKNNVNVTEEGLKNYFKKVIEVNNKNVNSPVLDFRVHIFLLEINNVLKRCINCGQYYTSSIDKCNECGHPVFPVYKKDTTKYVGKLEEGCLNGRINPNLPQDNGSIYVLVGKNNKCSIENENLKEKLTFSNWYPITEDGIQLQYEKDGNIELYYADNYLNKSKLEEELILLESTNKKEFMYKIIKYTLLKLSKDERKILTFIDNRESCGRYSAIFGDEFLSDFYMECLKFIDSEYNNLTIEESFNTLNTELNKVLERCVNDGFIDDNTKKIIINDFQIWFLRTISIPDNLKLEKLPEIKLVDDEAELSDIEKEVLNVFLTERCLNRQALKAEGNLILFNCKYLKFKKGVLIKDSYNGERTIEENYISLGKNAIKYKSFVRRLEEGKIRNAIGSLMRKAIVICPNRDNDNLYYLNTSKLKFELEKSTYSNIEEIIFNELLFSGAHSSEVIKNKKQKNENNFQDGRLNLLVSTPTLEMGIDIGKLNLVYMIGVPPMPSNYAQRAGRAGRRENRFALLLTFCSEVNNHDRYYFNNPKEMIEGVITPPVFDDKNRQLMNKHICAYIMTEFMNNAKTTAFNLNLKEKKLLEDRCRKVFNQDIDIEYHLQLLKDKIKEFKINKLDINTLYDLGIYPDYSFRRDEAKAINIEIEKYSEEDQKKNKEDLILSTREPEQAYKQFMPGEHMFLGDVYYKFTANGHIEVLGEEDNVQIRQFDEIYCTDKVKNIPKDKKIKKLDTVIKINPKRAINILGKKDVVNAYIEKNLNISFINKGIMGQGFSEEDKKFYLGYKLVRDAIVLEFDSSMVDDKQYLSLCAVLDRTIKDTLGFDESEIGWIMKEEIEFEGREKDKAYCILYDKTGSKNVDIERIGNSFIKILQNCYKKIYSCPCTKSSGCYLCMKGYAVQKYSHLLDKTEAKSFIGYLLGKSKFKPQMEFYREFFSCDLEINLKLNTAENNVKVFCNNSLYCNENYERMNESVFKALTNILKDNVGNDDIEDILIKANQDYIAKAINGESDINKDPEQFKLFKFYNLAFKSVKGEKSK